MVLKTSIEDQVALEGRRDLCGVTDEELIPRFCYSRTDKWGVRDCRGTGQRILVDGLNKNVAAGIAAALNGNLEGALKLIG
jgi:hypothetical protein